MNAFNAEGSVSKAIFLADTPSKPVSSGFIRYWPSCASSRQINVVLDEDDACKEQSAYR
jgi:hypothetical protein